MFRARCEKDRFVHCFNLGVLYSRGRGVKKDLASAVKLSDYQASMKIQGVTPVVSTPAQFAAYIRSEVQRYRQQLAPLHISLD